MSRNHFKINKGVSLGPVASQPSDPENGDLIYNSTDAQFQKYEGGVWKTLGSGAGGSVNLITNGNADEAAASIFIPYADAVSTRPTDGTGGSPNVTTSITSTTPLIGTKSYLLTKPAATNARGQGWSIPFTVDQAYRAKVLSISVDYIVNSGTFVAGSSTTDSDVIWYLYDITNSTLIEPSSIKMLSNSTTISDKYTSTFQTSATGSNYRLIAHVTTTATAAFELEVDNVTVSPSVYVYGSPITDWAPWTPTGSWTTNTTYTGRKRRVGDEYEYFVGISTSGAPNATTLSINIFDTIDMTKIPSTGIYASSFESSGNANDTGNGHAIKALYLNTTSVALAFINNGANSAEGLVSNTAPFTFGAGDQINVRFTLPILGISSSVQMSDSADTRIVAAQMGGAAVGTAAQTPIIFPNVANDTHGAYNTTTGRYLVQVPGYYRVTLYSLGGTIVAGQFAYVSVNGAAPAGLNSPRLGNTVNANDPLVGTGVVVAKAGDFIDIRPNVNYGAINAVSTASIERISGPSAIAASESVNCNYASSAGNAIGVSDTLQIFASKLYDSHGAYNTGTGVFTAPIAGKYRISANILTTNFVLPTTGTFLIHIYKNGSNHRRIGNVVGTGANTSYLAAGATTIELLAGETLSVYAGCNPATSQIASTAFNYLTIEKVG